MGCGPLPRRKSDCTTVTANLHRSIPAFRTPSGPPGHLPRFAEKGEPAGRLQGSMTCVNAVARTRGSRAVAAPVEALAPVISGCPLSRA